MEDLAPQIVLKPDEKIIHVQKKLSRMLSIIAYGTVNKHLDNMSIAKTLFEKDPSCDALIIFPDEAPGHMEALQYIPTYYRSSKVISKDAAHTKRARAFTILNSELQHPIGLVYWEGGEEPLYPGDTVFDQNLNCIWHVEQPPRKRIPPHSEKKPASHGKAPTMAATLAKQSQARR